MLEILSAVNICLLLREYHFYSPEQPTKAFIYEPGLATHNMYFYDTEERRHHALKKPFKKIRTNAKRLLL